MLQETDTYVTKDQFLTAVFIAKKMHIQRKQWIGDVCYFYFLDKEKCEKIEAQYFNGRLKIDAKQLFDAFKTVKSMLYAK